VDGEGEEMDREERGEREREKGKEKGDKKWKRHNNAFVMFHSKSLFLCVTMVLNPVQMNAMCGAMFVCLTFSSLSVCSLLFLFMLQVVV